MRKEIEGIIKDSAILPCVVPSKLFNDLTTQICSLFRERLKKIKSLEGTNRTVYFFCKELDQLIEELK